jgi:hypothetical protein
MLCDITEDIVLDIAGFAVDDHQPGLVAPGRRRLGDQFLGQEKIELGEFQLF